MLANWFLKGVGTIQTSILSSNTVFRSLHPSQESLRHVCFLQFSLISVQPLHCYISPWNLQIAHGNRFPLGNYHHISFIRVIKTGVLSMLIQKICHKGLLHLQKIVSQSLSANREPHTVIANHETWTYLHPEMACLSSLISGKETSTKKLYFHKEKDWLDAVVAAEILTYLFLMEVLQMNWFSMVELREARSDREIGLLTTRIQQFEEK